jgi:hypothetical protein
MVRPQTKPDLGRKLEDLPRSSACRIGDRHSRGNVPLALQLGDTLDGFSKAGCDGVFDRFTVARDAEGGLGRDDATKLSGLGEATSKAESGGIGRSCEEQLVEQAVGIRQCSTMATGDLRNQM